jgi:hypothetical protein
MVSADPESSRSDSASPAHAGNAPQAIPADPELALVGRGRLLAFAAFAGLIAGVASLLAGEVIMNHYQSDLLPTLKIVPSPEDMRRWNDARLYSAILTFTAMGGFLGLAMGLAGGLARRSAFAGARAAILGLLIGSATAASLAFILVPMFFKTYDPQSTSLLMPLLTHGAIWSSIGGASGLAFAAGLGGQERWKATLVGGLVGASAATMIYEIVGALAFASDKTDLPLSSSVPTRGMAQLLVAIFSAVGAALALRQSAK